MREAGSRQNAIGGDTVDRSGDQDTAARLAEVMTVSKNRVEHLDGKEANGSLEKRAQLPLDLHVVFEIVILKVMQFVFAFQRVATSGDGACDEDDAMVDHISGLDAFGLNAFGQNGYGQKHWGMQAEKK